MNRFNFSIVITASLILGIPSIVLSAQSTNKTITEIQVKNTPASVALVQSAVAAQVDKREYETKLQQARTTLDSNQKVLKDQLVALQKKIQAEIAQDKKYKTMVDQIDDLSKKLQESSNKAESDFRNDTGLLQQKLNSESSGMQMLIGVVRKENNLPDSATFNVTTGKWSEPKTVEASKEKK